MQYNTKLYAPRYALNGPMLHKAPLPPHWHPIIRKDDGPIYRQISRQLIEDIRSGRLKVGAVLPSHRELASALGITTSTVTKAYKEVARLDLIVSRPRAGTRVLQFQSQIAGWGGALRDDHEGKFDLANNCPPSDCYLLELSTILPLLVKRANFGQLQEYPPVAGLPSHRATASAWLGRLGVPCSDDQTVVVNGAQHGLASVLASQAKPGAILLAEELTYPSLLPLARRLQLEVRPIAMDAEGMIPESLQEHCSRQHGAILFVTPSLSNPTTATMSTARRRTIAAIADCHELTIVEDDVYRMFVSSDLPTFASLAPNRTFYLTSFSKCIAPGLRVGYVRAPSKIAADQVAAAVGLNTRMATPLMAEIASIWVEDGTVERIIECQRRELTARNAIVTSTLRGHIYAAQPTAMHLWLTLKNGWTALDFQGAARKYGILVVPSQAFSAGSSAPAAVRLTLGGIRRREDMKEALLQIANLNDSWWDGRYRASSEII